MRALLVCLSFLVACGASARDTSLRTSFVGVSAARDGFVQWDESHQDAIVESATSIADGKEKLAVYRAERVQIIAAFETAYRAISFAAITKDTPLLEMLAAAKSLYDAIEKLKASVAAPSP